MEPKYAQRGIKNTPRKNQMLTKEKLKTRTYKKNQKHTRGTQKCTKRS